MVRPSLSGSLFTHYLLIIGFRQTKKGFMVNSKLTLLIKETEIESASEIMNLTQVKRP